MPRGIALLCIVLCCVIYSAKGQVAGEATTLQHILQRVDQYDPTLQSEANAVIVRQRQQKRVSQNRLPNLNLSYQANLGSNNNVPGPYFGFGLVPTNNAGIRPENNYRAVTTDLGIAAFQWEFYNFGQYAAQDAVAKAATATQTERLAQRRYDIRSYAIHHYLQLMRYEELRAIQTASLQRTEDIRRSIWALVKSGIRAGVDTSMADAEISRARLRGIDLDEERNQLQVALAAVTGLEPAQIKTDTILTQRLDANIQLQYRPAQQRSQIHPWIAYRQAQVEQEQQRALLIDKSFRPKLFASGALWGRAASVDAAGNYESLAHGLGLQRGNYLFGLGITYNLFDLSRKKVQKKVQESQVNQSLLALQEEEVRLRASRQQANADVSIAQQRLDELPRQLKAARAAYRQKFALYKNGLTDIVDVHIAQNLLYDAERNNTNAKFAYYQAIWRKAVAENTLDQFITLFN